MADKILSEISMAQKAGQVVNGEFLTEHAVRDRRVYLLIVATDASDLTKKKMKNMASHYETPLYFYSDKLSLGKCIGKDFRSMVAVIHPEFANSIEKQLKSIS